MFDDINLIERDRRDGDGDAVILGLFQDWQAAMRRKLADDEQEANKKMEELGAIECQICDAPASGAVGFAVKTFLAVYLDRGGVPSPADECEIGPFDREVYGPSGALFICNRMQRGMLIDAARFLPDLAPLVARITEAPVALPPAVEPIDRRPELRARAEALVAEYSGDLPLGDAGLIEAERRQGALSAGLTALSREFDVDFAIEEEILTPTVLAAETRFWDFIGDAEPESLAGVAVKLRWARTQESDPEVGLGFVLGQCLDLLAREIAAGGVQR